MGVQGYLHCDDGAAEYIDRPDCLSAYRDLFLHIDKQMIWTMGEREHQVELDQAYALTDWNKRCPQPQMLALLRACLCAPERTPGRTERNILPLVQFVESRPRGLFWLEISA